MTSKCDSLKTNEFLRLRKLRLQQVREQSKDIAKKIRQRAKVEQLRQVSKVDANKEKEYLQQQEKLVNRLEQLYAKSVQNVGAGHKNASEVNEREKSDSSKWRGKEAAAVLKKKKQEKLDEQKKLLDRKLQAREVANVLSREKFAAVTNSLTKSTSSKSVRNADVHDKTNSDENVVNDNRESHKDTSDPITKNDMGTQWEFEELPNEWEPNIPKLPIPNDDSLKNSADDNVERYDQGQKNRRLNLFALSDEMPSSLRGGGIPSIPEERLPAKSSLTLVSEYIQNRGLKLREPDTTRLQKRNSDDLQSIKQTLLRTRASRTDGSVFPNICHVLDEQVIPVPSWRSEKNCEFCSHENEHIPRHCKNITNNIKYFGNASTLKPHVQHPLLNSEKPKPSPKYYNCSQNHKISVSGRSKVEHVNNSDDVERVLSKKTSVTMYDHNTKDTRDLPHNVDKLVVRDRSVDDDAYSQAIKEASVVDDGRKSHHTMQQEARNRLATTRQNVDKEYRDTLAFLNSLPKERPVRSIRTAYMDGDREQELKDQRQCKLQQEYKKIEKQNNKHRCKHTRNRVIPGEQTRSKAKSPVASDTDNNIVNRDFQYSWLPIPESDGNMAIHTIPSNTKYKPGNSVKFSSVDTYHEYRSRHKHTPPTKDIDNEPNKRVVEAVIIQEDSNDSMVSSFETDTSSVENLHVRQDNTSSRKVNKNQELADAERIIIYKVMETKKSKNKKHKTKKKSHNVNNINKVRDAGNKSNEIEDQNENRTNKDGTDKSKMNTFSFTQLQEGIYKSVSANGLSYNIMSCCTNVDLWQTSSERKPWWDNVASLYFSDKGHSVGCDQSAKSAVNEQIVNNNTTGTGKGMTDNTLDRKRESCDTCKNANRYKLTDKRPSAATSTSSFKTAVNDKVNDGLLDGGYIKIVDEGGKDTGNFYVGASGFLKDDAYEVIIQLRKKEAEKIIKNDSQEKNNMETKKLPKNNIEENGIQSNEVHSIIEIDNSPKDQNETENHVNPQKEKLDSTKNNLERIEQREIPNNKIAAQNEINLVDSEKEKPIVKPLEISDKGISTTFHDAFAIPDTMPKLDTISKPVASTCTQTTQNLSIPRPVLMHLSSSTSTTYMSPPELILPRYLRKVSSESCDDTYEPVSSNFNSQNVKFTSCKACKCGKCTKKEKVGKADTPPNTSRSTDQTTDNFATEKQHKKCAKSECRHKNIKSHKCKKNSDSKICSKKKRSPMENKNIRSGSNYSPSSNKKSKIIANIDKVNLNPVVENYVKKLLALNKEGLKAIEVINQDCSTVNTPGSSVIDIMSNINQKGTTVGNKISLEQIKNSLKEQILKNAGNTKNITKRILKSTGSQTEKNIKLLYKFNKKRPVHKVKSLNISKQLIKMNHENRRNSVKSTVITTSPCSVNSRKGKTGHFYPINEKRKPQCEKLPTPRPNQEFSNNTSNSETSRESRRTFKSRNKINVNKVVTKTGENRYQYQSKTEIRSKAESYPFSSYKATGRSHSSESEASNDLRNRRNLSTPPISISTQTNQVDSEVEFMKLAENKLQNMEKIADLTEKCTKRLSNLAKVLEEVRRNKSLAYSQITTSDCTSDSDRRSDIICRSDKNMQTSITRQKTFESTDEVQPLTEASCMPKNYQEEQNRVMDNVSSYVPILMDLPKPDTFKKPSLLTLSTDTSKAEHIIEQKVIKNKGKPPPALTKINLKHVPEGFVIPHELSTVVEVDSPMSLKTKSHTTQIDNKYEVTNTEIVDDIHRNKTDDEKPIDANAPISKFNKSKKVHETHSTDTSEDSKLKMMDLKYFNEIMLQPFISLKDYAKQFNLEELDGQTSLNGNSKNENVNEELSSLHSETSIPDVMAELLKRNLISEPFKFETTSNVNSTTVSSESTLSLLALSRAKKDKKKSAMLVKNKENIAETSVSLSISSNPDLEHAFQRLGMGWASSTLKKTKERLALSSSSNTSSSSIPQFKIKSFNYQDIPELSSLLNTPHKEEVLKPQVENLNETPKNALQQTSVTNSMTVKEFLTNELANKITFSNKTNRNATEDEFVSLCETKMPEEVKYLSEKPQGNEKSIDSLPSGSNNRARTSTPVQIFKSMAYHSTSSSNTSNGLFSNADDLSSVKGTSNSVKNHSTSDKDDLTIPNYSLKTRKEIPECSKSD